jgi:hypothetical protein
MIGGAAGNGGGVIESELPHVQRALEEVRRNLSLHERTLTRSAWSKEAIRVSLEGNYEKIYWIVLHRMRTRHKFVCSHSDNGEMKLPPSSSKTPGIRAPATIPASTASLSPKPM